MNNIIISLEETINRSGLSPEQQSGLTSIVDQLPEEDQWNIKKLFILRPEWIERLYRNIEAKKSPQRASNLKHIVELEEQTLMDYEEDSEY